MIFDIRLASIEDALQISFVLKQVYLETYAIEGVTKEFANFITEQFSFNKVSEEIGSDQFEFWVATCNGNPIAVLKIEFGKKISTLNFSAPEINKLYLMKRFQKRGIGKRLLQSVEDNLKERGAQFVWLEVWSENKNAINFYKKINYREVGETWFRIEKNRYLNKVMLKEL